MMKIFTHTAKRVLFTASLGLMAASAVAGPAKNVKRTVTLPGGLQTELTLTGDEHNHYWVDLAQNHYRQTANGAFELIPAEEVEARQQKAQAARLENNVRRVKRSAIGENSEPIVGDKKGIVILVNFSDLAMISSQSDFNALFNEHGYSKYTSIGCVSDYFYDQSYGKLNIDFDVVGPFTMANTMSYYGASNGTDNDSHPAEMIIEAVKAADAAGVDFSKYDWDGDGEVDQVYVVYAGYGESSGAPSNTIWPHEWNLASAKYYGDGTGPVSVDGVKVDTYACSYELDGTSGTQTDGIGSATHEFSHCLGLPDFYDTSGSNYGMGHWDNMASGSYNGNGGYVPAGYTSYERMFAGWLTPIEITEQTHVEALPALTSSPTAYVIYNKANRNEYYLLENRANESWDAQLPANGLLIVHVDFDLTTWKQNQVNVTADHQRMTIIPANGALSTSAEYGHTWPQPGCSELTNTTEPAAEVYNTNSDGTKFMSFDIRNITKNDDGTISFYAGNDALDAPVADEATNVTATGFTANWQAVSGASNYDVTLVRQDKSYGLGYVFYEDFEGIMADADGRNDLSSDLDSYMTEKGWTGSKVYLGEWGAKLGSSTANGWIQTPDIAVADSAIMIIYATAYNSKGSTITITASLDGTEKSFSFDTTDDEYAQRGVKIMYTGNVNFKIAAKNRASLRLFYVATNTELAEYKVVCSYKTGDTSYTFSDIANVGNYLYYVTANNEAATSSMSNVIKVPADPTGIETITVDDAEATFYTVSGVRVNGVPTQKGVYISGGKKVVVK